GGQSRRRTQSGHSVIEGPVRSGRSDGKPPLDRPARVEDSDLLGAVIAFLQEQPVAGGSRRCRRVAAAGGQSGGGDNQQGEQATARTHGNTSESNTAKVRVRFQAVLRYRNARTTHGHEPPCWP